MQISGVSLALTWPHRLCLFRVLLCGSLCYRLSPFQALGKVILYPCCQACVFIYSSCGRWVFHSSPVEFSSLRYSPAFPLLIAGCVPCPRSTRASPAHPACLFTVLGRIPFPQSSALSAPHPLSCVSLLFLLLITQLGQSVQRAMLLWSRLVCESTVVLQSSPGPCLSKSSGHGKLAARGPSWFLCLN
jgi:hypothetical protein